MKLIIIEGIDRVGKDTLIKGLFDTITENKQNIIYRHFKSPLGDTDEDKIFYQKESFKREFDFYLSIKHNGYLNKDNVFVWNRSHIGEYVYGKMYRNYNPDWIYDLEQLYMVDYNIEIYLILLKADAQFACDNDDGNSFTKELDKKQMEIDLFEEAFRKSLIKNKITIKVNEGNEFKHHKEIFRDIKKFVGY